MVSSLAVLATLSACSANSARDPIGGAAASGNGGSTGGDGSGGSGADGNSGIAGGLNIIATDGGIRGMGECGGQTFPLARKPAKLLLVFDRSGSMRDPPDGASASTSKWALTVPAVNEVITATDARVSWGLKTFPEGDVAYCGVTDPIDVPIAAANAAKVTAAISTTTPNGNGTPTGDAMNAAVKYLKSLDAAGDTDQKYILLATDGEPSCVNGAEASQATSRPYAVQAVTAAAVAGYQTFVVGVATTKTSATQALNDMAVAGQRARPDPNPLATKFYLANTKDELVAALVAVTGVILDCRFALSSSPPDGERVGVLLGTERIPPDSWTYTDADKMTVEVTGASCDEIKNGSSGSVRIIFGCPQDPIR